MVQKQKTEYSFFAAEDKWDVDKHKYSGANGSQLGKNIDEIVMLPSQYDTKACEVKLAVKTGGSSADYVAETVKALLANGGFKQAEIQSYDNQSGFVVSIDKVTPADLIKIAAALATDAPKDRNDTHFAILDKGIAGEIIQAELQRQNLSPASSGLLQIKSDPMAPERMKAMGLETPFAYTDVDLSGYPLSPITAMREDGNYASSAFIKNAMYVETKLFINDQSSAIKKALEEANIKTREINGGKVLVAGAPVDAVAEALGKAGILPKSFADEIAAAAEKGHHNQRQINADISAMPMAAKLETAKPAALKV